MVFNFLIIELVLKGNKVDDIAYFLFRNYLPNKSLAKT